MTTRNEFDRSISAWLEAEAPSRAPDDVLEASRDRIRNTRQRRFWWPAWRRSDMNNFAKVLVATAAVAVVAVVGINVLPGSQTGAGGSPPASPSAPPPSPSPSPSPTPEPTASLVAHALKACCTEDNPRVAAMTFTVMAPPSWDAFSEGGAEFGVTSGWSNPVDGDEAFVGVYPGGNLFSDPCLTNENADADIRVGPAVDDLVKALADHPKLDVTASVDVTLAGHSGKYLDLTTPDDISKCARYFPMDHHIYAQGAGQRWHLWILDVDGVRVLVETNDYRDTPPGVLAEEPAIVQSLVITP